MYCFVRVTNVRGADVETKATQVEASKVAAIVTAMDFMIVFCDELKSNL
jgi:hypothetical protein